MAVFVWDEKFSVGIKIMDDQHKHFLKLLNNLNDEIHRESGTEMMEAAINSLTNYGTVHFRTEEKILFTCGYPETEEQRREHGFFASQIKEMAACHQRGSLVRMASVVSILRDWFLNHIMVEDKKYAAFIRSSCPSERLSAAA